MVRNAKRLPYSGRLPRRLFVHSALSRERRWPPGRCGHITLSRHACQSAVRSMQRRRPVLHAPHEITRRGQTMSRTIGETSGRPVGLPPSLPTAY